MIDPCWSKGKGGRSRCKFGRISYHATIGLESPKSNTHSNHKPQNENRVSKFKLIFVPRKTRQCRFSPHFQRPHWHHLQGFGIIIDIIGNPKQRQFSSNAHHDCFAGRLYDWDEKKVQKWGLNTPMYGDFPGKHEMIMELGYLLLDKPKYIWKVYSSRVIGIFQWPAPNHYGSQLRDGFI